MKLLVRSQISTEKSDLLNMNFCVSLLSRIREQDAVQGDQPAATNCGRREVSAECRYVVGVYRG